MRWIIGGIVAVVVIAAGAYGLREYVLAPAPHETTDADSAGHGSTGDAKPVPDSALTGLLLTDAQAADVFGKGPMGAWKSTYDATVYEAMVQRWTAADQSCQVGAPGDPGIHDGTGWRSVRYRASAALTDHSVRFTQAVVSYADADAARRFVDGQAAAMRQCAGRNVNLKDVADGNAQNSFWAYGDVTDANDTVSQSRAEEGGAGWACHDALAPRNNVVIELYVCSDVPSPPVDEVVNAIAKNIEEAS